MRPAKLRIASSKLRYRPMRTNQSRHPKPGRRSWPGSALDSDLDVASEHQQEPHQALDREARQLALLERRDFGLIDSENRGRLTLSETSPLDLGDYFRSQLGLRQQIVGMWKFQVGEHVSGTRR